MNFEKTYSTRRNSSIEILRIIAMLMIVFFHAFRNVTFEDISFGARCYAKVIGEWGLVGVDLFVIISAYFLVDQKFKMIRVLDTMLKTCGYLIIFTLLFVVLNLIKGNNIYSIVYDTLYNIAKGFFDPLWMNQYWFVTAYLFMIIISPLCNVIFNRLNIDSIKKIILVFSFIPVFSCFLTSNLIIDIINFIYIYLLIGFIKKSEINIKPIIAFLSAFIASATLLIFNLLTSISTDKPIFLFFQKLISKTLGNAGRHSIIILFIALMLFEIFRNFRPFNSKIINYISSHTFGVYLFHENHMVNVIDIILSEAIRIGLLGDHYHFCIYYTFIVLAVFFAGILFDTVYSLAIHNQIIKNIKSKYKTRLDKIDYIFNTLIN